MEAKHRPIHRADAMQYFQSCHADILLFTEKSLITKVKLTYLFKIFYHTTFLVIGSVRLAATLILMSVKN
jgi:hypothetical protein